MPAVGAGSSHRASTVLCIFNADDKGFGVIYYVAEFFLNPNDFAWRVTFKANKRPAYVTRRY